MHGRVLVRPGGSAANAAVWAVEAGATSRVHARIGSDMAGALLRDELIARGVEPALAIDRTAETGTMLVVHEPRERSMVADRGAGGRLSPDDLPERLEAGAVLVSGYTLLFEPTSAAGVAALERARARFVAVDAASWPMIRSFGVERFLDACAPATLLLANEREAEELTGRRDVHAVDELSRRFPVVCVKQGDEGRTDVVGGARDPQRDGRRRREGQHRRGGRVQRRAAWRRSPPAARRATRWPRPAARGPASQRATRPGPNAPGRPRTRSLRGGGAERRSALERGRGRVGRRGRRGRARDERRVPGPPTAAQPRVRRAHECRDPFGGRRPRVDRRDARRGAWWGSRRTSCARSPSPATRPRSRGAISRWRSPRAGWAPPRSRARSGPPTARGSGSERPVASGASTPRTEMAAGTSRRT